MVAPLRRAVESSAAAYAASLLPGGPRSRFVIVCLPRTGSELLVDVFDQLPGVSCRGEILQQPVHRPIRVLTGRARLGALRGARVWGCKLLVQHLQWYQGGYGPAADVLGQLTARGWTVVHLRRTDVLAGALSALQAEQTQRWHRRDREDAAFEPVDADVATMLAWVHTTRTSRGSTRPWPASPTSTSPTRTACRTPRRCSAPSTASPSRWGRTPCPCRRRCDPPPRRTPSAASGTRRGSSGCCA